MPLPRSASALLLMTLAGLGATGSNAHAAMIGVVAPKSGPYAALGTQIFEGARAAAAATGDTIVEIDESCEEAGGSAAARLLAEAKAEIAVGFLCVETLASAMPALAASGVPAITLSVRSRILMEDALRNDWPLLRMAPSEAAEADALAEAILARWKAAPIAFIDDGTIYGRELVSTVRQKLEPLGIAPVFVDTLRPGQEQQIALVRRLQKAGATHVLIGADRNDIAIIARDAAEENIALTVLGGDAMRAANRPVPLRDGTLAVTLPEYRTVPDAQTIAATLQTRGIEPEGHVLPAYAAMQIAGQAAARADGDDKDRGKALMAALLRERFETVIGEIGFSSTHERADNPYRLLEWRGGNFLAPTDPAE